MECKRLFTLLVLCLLTAVVGGQALAARTVTGTVLSCVADRVSVKVDGGEAMAIRAVPKAVIMRGQLGKVARNAKLSEFAAGDRIVAVVNQDGSSASLKAFYGIAKGTLASASNGKLFFKDGRSVKLHPGVPVVFADGKVGKSTDLKAGQQLLCRINPTSGEAWTVVAQSAIGPKVVPKPTEVAVAPVAPDVKPVIESVSFKGPSDPKPKDWIRVDLIGTPGGRAVCEIKGLIPRTVMAEVLPGAYRASVMIPSGKIVHKEALLGYLTIAGVDAPTVQAGKLFTVDPYMTVAVQPIPVPEPEPEPEPEPVVAPVPVPTPPAPEPVPVVAPPKVKAPVVVTAPAFGSKIQSALSVSGTAEPGANVMVVVSYSNGIQGLLNLSGQVSSQLVAAGPTGEFKMGPIALEGPLATKGLILTVNAYYPEDEGKVAARVSAYGDRG